MVKLWEIQTEGAELLREYRDTDAKRFYLEQKLQEEIEDYIYSSVDYTIDLNVFFNDRGKYIIIESWGRRFFFNDELITRFCEKYKVTYEGVTREIHTDYEGNESLGKITYLFEIIK